MLCFSQYKYLDQSERADLLLEDGVYLDLVRYTRNFYVELYALADFYVEVYFDKATEQPFIRPFSNLRYLDPYLKEVSINQLIAA